MLLVTLRSTVEEDVMGEYDLGAFVCVVVVMWVDVVCLYVELVCYGLVVWIGGNVLGWVFGADFFVIKFLGVVYDDFMLENMIFCDLDGVVVFGSFGSDRSSLSDIVAYVYVYCYLFEVGGVVHIHLFYVVVWAACVELILCVMTGIVDEFGGFILIGSFVIIGDDLIGCGIVETLCDHRLCVVFM